MAATLSQRCSRLLFAVASTFAVALPMAHAEVRDPGGLWAVEYTVPVRWRMNLALEGGKGEVRMLALVAREPDSSGGPLRFDEHVTLCGVFQPPTKTMSLYGGERFSVTYNGENFGPQATGASSWQGEGDDGALVGSPIALQVGLDMPAPLETPWPRQAGALIPYLMPVAANGLLGAPATSRTDGDYIWPPVDYAASRRAHTFYIASRTVVSTRVKFAGDADHLEGAASLSDVAGRAGLNTFIVGCETDDGGRCHTSDLTLTNSFQPSMRANGEGRARMVRLSPGAGCSDVRALF